MIPLGAEADFDIFACRLLQVADLGGRLEDVGLRQPERLLVAAVEALREVAGELEVLALVLADRHEVRAVEQDVGGLEDRVGEQADRGRALALLGRLVLELGHPAGLAEAGQAVEDPAELRVLGDLALHEDRRPGRVDAHRQQLRGRPQGALAQQLRVLLDGDRVQVGDEEERLVVALEVDPLAQRAEVVAEVEGVRGRLDARQHAGTRPALGHLRLRRLRQRRLLGRRGHGRDSRRSPGPRRTRLAVRTPVRRGPRRCASADHSRITTPSALRPAPRIAGARYP